MLSSLLGRICIWILKLFFWLLGMSGSISICWNEELAQAIRDGNLKAFRCLVNWINVSGTDEAGSTPLHIACRHGHVDIVKEIVSRGGNVKAKNNNGQTPMHVAFHYNHMNELSKILSISGTFDEKAKKAMYRDLYDEEFFKACKHGKIGVVKQSIDIDRSKAAGTDNDGNTPIHMAAKFGHLDVVKLLCSQGGIDVNAMNEKLDTPLRYACEKGNMEMMELLWRLGAKVNTKNELGNTVLHKGIPDPKPNP